MIYRWSRRSEIFIKTAQKESVNAKNNDYEFSDIRVNHILNLILKAAETSSILFPKGDSLRQRGNFPKYFVDLLKIQFW